MVTKSAYSIDVIMRGGYTIGAEGIIGMCASVKKFVEEDASLEIKLAGEHSIEGNDVYELVDDPYVKNRKIVQMAINGSSRGKEVSRRVTIRLGQPYESSVRLTVSGDRQGCIVLVSEVENVLAGCAEWYRRFMPPENMVTALLAPVLAIVTGNVVVYGYSKAFGRELLSVDNKVDVLVALEIVLVSIILYFGKRFLFPKLVFNIGKSAGRGESAKLWRGIAFVGVVLGLIVAIAGGLIVERMK